MDIPQILHPSRLRVVEDGEGGAFFALSPETQAQLDRIEWMLKELTSLPHNKRDPLFQGPPPSAPDQKYQQIDGHVWAPRPPK